LIGLITSPVGGFFVALFLMVAIYWIFAKFKPTVVRRFFGKAQIGSAAIMAFSHGTNDAQKTMGIIALALVVSGHLAAEEFDVPLWVIVSAAIAMGAGTYAGGWRIIKTLGQRVAKLDPPQGFAAQTSTATILWLTAHYGFPVSTTHTISGSVLGAGATRRLDHRLGASARRAASGVPDACKNEDSAEGRGPPCVRGAALRQCALAGAVTQLVE
jgi:inorganic phosphate transporter, PiT family